MVNWVATTIRGARKVPWAKVLAAVAWLNQEVLGKTLARDIAQWEFLTENHLDHA